MEGVRSMIRRLGGLLREEMTESELQASLLLDRPKAAGRIQIVALLAHERDRQLLFGLAQDHGWILHLAARPG